MPPDRQHPVGIRGLGAEGLVLPSPVHGLRRIVDEHAGRAKLRLHPNLAPDSSGTLIGLARHGFGRTLLPPVPIHHAMQQGLLCVAPLQNPTPERRVVLAFPVDRATTQAAQAAADILVEITAGLAGEGVWIGQLLAGHAHGEARRG